MPQNIAGVAQNKFISKRLAFVDREFISVRVEKTIKTGKSVIRDKEIAWLFENCFPNTLDTAIDYETIDGKPDICNYR
jgi:hypothetical protein